MSGHTPLLLGPLRSPHSVTGMGSVGTSVELGRGVGTFVAFRGRGEWRKQRETQIEGQSLSRAAKERPHLSFLWVHLCILSQGIRACYSLSTPLPLLWAVMGVSRVPHYRVGRKSFGPVPLKSRLSLPRAAVPAGFCPQFQPLAVCPS